VGRPWRRWGARGGGGRAVHDKPFTWEKFPAMQANVGVRFVEGGD